MEASRAALEKGKPYLSRCCENNKFTWEYYSALYERDSAKNNFDRQKKLQEIYEQCRNKDISVLDSFYSCAIVLSTTCVEQAKYAEAEEILLTALQKVKRFRSKNKIEIRALLDTLVRVYDLENKQGDKQKCLNEIKAL